MPTVVPYTEPAIPPNVGTPWPQMVNEKIAWLMGEVGDLRQQVRDLQSTQQALIVAMLKTEDGDDGDDTDF